MPKNKLDIKVDEFEEKQLSKDVILGAIESAMVSAYRRAVNASTAQHVEAKIDSDTGKVLVFAEKEVVEDVLEPKTEVLLEEARKVNPNAQIGDMVIVETTPADFGRVAAQTARQVIQERIREAERSNQMQYFERQVGEIVSGIVQATNAQATTVGLDMKAEGVLPGNQRIPGERFKVHDRVRAVVLEVKDDPRGPQIILSRAHRNFLRRLLENEVPEIYHGVVEIRAISREPGARAKVAVMATQAGVDPVGACLGIKGVRIQAIVKELHDEKIDIIQWDQDPVVYISRAISPARVSGVYLSEVEGNRTATVVVNEDQLRLAIGRDGQNARLAAKLTGWRIDIKSLAEAAGDAIQKLRTDLELSALLPNAVELIPAVEEVLAKKAENRPVTPEEFTMLAQFVDRVEQRTIQIKEDAARAVEEKTASARSEVPTAAFGMPLEDIGLKEHVFNILVEAGFDTVGALMMSMKMDANRVLRLPGIGPKARQNIEETLAALTFSTIDEQADIEEEPKKIAAEVDNKNLTKEDTGDEIRHTNDKNSVPPDNGDLPITYTKEKNFRISISCPIFISKRFESVFLCQIYFPENRSKVIKNMKNEFQGQDTTEHVEHSSIKRGQNIKVKLFSPEIEFSDPVTKIIDDGLNKITFLGKPKDNCEPGIHRVLVSICDTISEQEFESLTFIIRIVDFAFDHISRPLISTASTVVLSVGSFVMFILALLEQIDKTIGLTSGTAAGVLAAVIYANFHNLYKRVYPTTP